MDKHLLKLNNKGTKPASKNINVVSNFVNLVTFLQWDNICRCSTSYQMHFKVYTNTQLDTSSTKNVFG